MKITVHHAGRSVEATEETWRDVADNMVKEHGPWVPGESRIERQTSEFGAGNQVVDSEAKARNERTQEALREAGMDVDSSRQLYATGTRMAQVGYDTQRDRAREHAGKLPVAEAAAQLVNIIEAERRRNITVDAETFGKKLSVNGALAFDGLKLREQAIRGLLSRMESPALRYVLGLRDRIAGEGCKEAPTPEQKKMDRESLVDVLQRECKRFPGLQLNLRARDGLGDIFAVVSPDYGVADAPEVMPSILDVLPEDARASFSYDPVSTSWEMRANVWTPTPVDMQAVGEAFEGFSSFRGKDNGTGRIEGGGGLLILACLNAGTLVTNSEGVSRVHRKRVLVDLHTMAEGAAQAIVALCKAWSIARGQKIARPADDAGKLIPLVEAIPGFYRHMLTARKGELVGVLPGRTEGHVKSLALAYQDQRRDTKDITRADLAQGFTKYIQGQATPVRRQAEAAIGKWLVSSERVNYAVA